MDPRWPLNAEMHGGWWKFPLLVLNRQKCHDLHLSNTFPPLPTCCLYRDFASDVYIVAVNTLFDDSHICLMHCLFRGCISNLLPGDFLKGNYRQYIYKKLYFCKVISFFLKFSVSPGGPNFPPIKKQIKHIVSSQYNPCNTHTYSIFSSSVCPTPLEFD